MNHPFKFVALLVITATLASLPTQARESTACYSVDAKRGWQYINLTNSFSRVDSIRGKWTVDVVNFDRVGPEGYAQVEEYNGFNYDDTLPLGALLIGVPGSTYTWLSEPQQLEQPVTNVAIRINDNDLALADNFGSLRVCFSN
ncbi:MAG: hypothetical protein Kow00121_23700 [Elainellaceae cyanobacterium]